MLWMGQEKQLDNEDKSLSFSQGVIDMMPLSISVLPWGILAGSVAIQAGLSVSQAIAMSAIVFAGAAQLVSLGMVMSGASALTIFFTIFLITSQHCIYALTLRQNIAPLSLKDRLPLGFLLTDELFAVAISKLDRNKKYLLGAGLSFYIAWVLFSVLGIYLASTVPNLSDFHLDFSIVAVFVAIIVPLIKNQAAFVGVVVTLLAALVFKYFHIDAAIVLSGVIGMLTSMCLEAKGGQ